MRQGGVGALIATTAHSFRPMLKITSRLTMCRGSFKSTSVNIVLSSSNLKIHFKLTSQDIRMENVRNFAKDSIETIKHLYILIFF